MKIYSFTFIAVTVTDKTCSFSISSGDRKEGGVNSNSNPLANMQPMEGHPTRKGVTEDGQPSNEPKSRRYEIRTLLDIGRRLGAKSDSFSYSCNTIDGV